MFGYSKTRNKQRENFFHYMEVQFQQEAVKSLRFTDSIFKTSMEKRIALNGICM